MKSGHVRRIQSCDDMTWPCKFFQELSIMRSAKSHDHGILFIGPSGKRNVSVGRWAGSGGGWRLYHERDKIHLSYIIVYTFRHSAHVCHVCEISDVDYDNCSFIYNNKNLILNKHTWFHLLHIMISPKRDWSLCSRNCKSLTHYIDGPFVRTHITPPLDNDVIAKIFRFFILFFRKLFPWCRMENSYHYLSPQTLFWALFYQDMLRP